MAANFSTSSTSFQDAGLKLTLPAAGVWLFIAELRGLSATGGNFSITELYNFTTSTSITDSVRLSNYAAAANERQYVTVIRRVVTSTANNQVGVRLKSGGAYTSTIESDPNGLSAVLAIQIG